MIEKADHSKATVDFDTHHITEITSIIRPLMASIINDVISTHALKLFLEDDNYIVQAVWGPVKGGSLDDTQSDINNRINGCVPEIMNLVLPNATGPSQEFVIEFLIREKILSNISFLLERGRRWAMIKNDAVNNGKNHIEAAFDSFVGKVGNA
jgi:hypothetical protein